MTVFCVLLILPSTVAAAEDGALYVAGWRAAAFGDNIQGMTCWIAAADTALRVEILSLPTADLADAAVEYEERLAALLERRGDGWTYAKVGHAQPGLLNGWGQQWREVSPDLARLLQTVSAALASDLDGTAARWPTLRETVDEDDKRASRWRAALPSRRRLQQPYDRFSGDLWVAEPGSEAASRYATPADARWRQDLVARGRGRGGLTEEFTLTWVEPAGDDVRSQLAVRSLRRHGTLYLWLLATEPVRYPAVETFLPLWPLAQLLDR